ncbi:MAG: hypothetical protein NTW04_04640 [Elusimicrobia bacterium]|nr:hypothetical protein [Elusimicrobiota bacterium]
MNSILFLAGGVAVFIAIKNASSSPFGYTSVVLQLLGVASSMGICMLVFRIFASSKREDSSVTDLVSSSAKETSSFARLDPGGSFGDKLDLFLVKRLKLEPRLEEMYTLLGAPANLDPLKMLHGKEVLAVVAFALIFLLTKNVFFAALMGVLGFIAIQGATLFTAWPTARACRKCALLWGS